jgi:hypothetical protein
VPAGAVAVQQLGLGPGGEVDDAVVDLRGRIHAELFLDEEPASALVDLALVVVHALLGKVGELASVLAVGQAAQLLVAGPIA